jgi:membrane protease subunit HflK
VIPVRQIGFLVLLIMGVGLFLWVAFTTFYTVEADEVGVVLRLGRYTGTPAPPGLHFKLPFGIDTVEPVKVGRVHKLEFGFQSLGVSAGGRTEYRHRPEESLMLTGDQNVVNVEWIVQYKIKDPVDNLFRIKDPQETIRDLSEQAMRLVVGDSSATEVLTARRREIAFEVRKKLQEALDGYRAGVEVQTVELQDVVPPPEVQDSFNEVNRARQEKETSINQANSAYLKAIPEAEGEAQKLVQEAEGYQLKRVNEARGDVAKFEKLVAEYTGAKDVTRRRLYLEAMEAVLPRLKHVYVIDEGTTGPLQLLDLKEPGSGGAEKK